MSNSTFNHKKRRKEENRRIKLNLQADMPVQRVQLVTGRSNYTKGIVKREIYNKYCHEMHAIIMGIQYQDKVIGVNIILLDPEQCDHQTTYNVQSVCRNITILQNKIENNA